MAFKHQDACYRAFEGTRWPNLCDVLDVSHTTDGGRCKAAGVRIKTRKHPAGYQQAFQHPADSHLVGEILRAAHERA